MPLVTRTATAGIWKAQSTEPQDKTSGVGWIDTSTTPPNLKVADGTEYKVAAIEISSGKSLEINRAVVL